MTWTARVYDRAGVSQAVITDPVRVRFTDPHNDAGDGSVTVPYDHAAIAALTTYGNIVRVRDGTSELFGFEVRAVDWEVAQPNEEAGRLVTVSGDGVAIILGSGDVGGSPVYPEFGPAGLRSDIRWFGWMSCSCFDRSGWSAPAMAVPYKTPTPPFTSASPPDDWPDPNAARLWCEAPSQTGTPTNEVQSISLGDSISSGTFTLTFEGQTTSAIGSTWSAAQVESALEALSTIDGVTVTGAGITSNPYLITFDGANVAGRNVPLITVNHTSLIHTPNVDVVTEVTRGQPGTFAHTPGCCYGHDTFTTTTTQSVVLFVNMRSIGEFWLDGVKVYDQPTSAAAARTQTVSIDLPAGEHCVTWKTCVFSGFGWILWSIAPAVQNDDGSWTLGPGIRRSSSGATMMSAGLSDPEPGVTVGAILECLFDEAQARVAAGAAELDGFTWSFDPDDDTNNVAWADEFTWGIPVGTGYLDVVQQLADLSGVAWRMHQTLRLDVWQTRGTDRTGTVTLSSVTQSSFEGQAVKATTLLVQTQEGLSEATDAAGVAAFGNRRLGVTLGTALTFAGLADFAVHTFAGPARAKTRAVVEFPHVTGATPYVNFDVDDLITAANQNGSNVGWRVLAIQGQTVPEIEPPQLWTVHLIDVPS